MKRHQCTVGTVVVLLNSQYGKLIVISEPILKDTVCHVELSDGLRTIKAPLSRVQISTYYSGGYTPLSN